jgi:hypothetical protein
MGKNKDIEQLINLMCKSLRHKIGAIVNESEIYAEKYAKDAETIMKEAEKVLHKQNLNNYDKKIIKEKLKVKLKKELEEKDFLGDKKFDIMDEEIEKAIQKFNLF